MERIQAALAKARASREAGGVRRTDPSKRVLRKNDPAEEAAVDGDWSAIPTVALEPRRLRAKRVTAFESGADSVDFDRLRTRALQRMHKEGWRRIAIVSPTAQNGKSTVAANLAFSCARQSHLTTMLLELDLRRPGLASILSLSSKLDFSRVLADEAALTENAVRPRENLIVAPARSVANAAEFLHSPDTVKALDALVDRYDPSIVIYDMPPMGISDDVIGFLAHADCALIVAAAGSSTMDEIDRCEREVAERTSVLGIVLNKCRYERQQDDYAGYK